MTHDPLPDSAAMWTPIRGWRRFPPRRLRLAWHVLRGKPLAYRIHADDFNLITSSGRWATQTVKHLHIHYVPRRKDDGLTLPWTGQAQLAETPPKKWTFFDV